MKHELFKNHPISVNERVLREIRTTVKLIITIRKRQTSFLGYQMGKEDFENLTLGGHSECKCSLGSKENELTSSSEWITKTKRGRERKKVT